MKDRFWHDFLEIRTAVCTEIEEQFAGTFSKEIRTAYCCFFLHANRSPYNVFIVGSTVAVEAESGHENRGGSTTFIAVLFRYLLVLSSWL